MKVIYKIWLEEGSDRAFGEGPYRLLKGIQMTGSLWRAATIMGMAYTRARWLIFTCERTLGFALTRRKAGGVAGGGSQVTAEAVELMKKYEALRADMEGVLGGLYRKHFGKKAEVQFYKVIPRKRAGKPTVILP
jgi:molybdate transport system regulatory protein